MCSASKVRCDKQKPMCSRCEKLSYPCFYSPARRIRKRRLDEIATSASENQEFTHRWTETQDHDDGMSRETNEPRTSNAGEESNGPASLPTHDSSCSLFPMSHSNFAFPHQVNSQNDKAKSLRLSPTHTTFGQISCPRNANHSDCATVALDLLSLINQTSLKESGLSSMECAVRTTSKTMKGISTVLICPCSTKPDVGFLVSAVCSALLDIYQALLPEAPDRNNAQSVRNEVEEYFHDNVAVLDSGRLDMRRDAMQDGKATLMRILGELPKIADLVTQFRNRYSQQGDLDSTELFEPLAASMTSRLRSMIDRFTQHLVES